MLFHGFFVKIIGFPFHHVKLVFRALPETGAEANGRRFISAPLEICSYLASAYGVGEPH